MLSQSTVHCPRCRTAVTLSKAARGDAVCCPNCHQDFAVSSSEARTLAPTAAIETLDAESGNTSWPGMESNGSGFDRSPAKLGKFGRFEIQNFLGQGAFGRVYKAYDPELERHVALKVPNFGPDDVQRFQRFVVEAKSAGRLRHPNIVAVYESGKIGDEHYIASQFVSGEPLSKRIKDNPPSFRQAADWVRQLAYALAYAHAEGIVHRDIKPENIMLDAQGLPQIMDFGLAKRVNEDSTMTVDGSVMGTPLYMSPEQAQGNIAGVGPRSDQYSLGVVLYELLTRKTPFHGSQHAVIAQVIADEPLAPRALDPTIPKDLEAICLVAMNKDREQRYASAADFGDDLARWLGGFETRARPQHAGEKLVRWYRRNQAVATLSGMLGVSLLFVALLLIPRFRPSIDSNNQLAQDRVAPVASPITPQPTKPLDEPPAPQRPRSLNEEIPDAVSQALASDAAAVSRPPSPQEPSDISKDVVTPNLAPPASPPPDEPARVAVRPSPIARLPGATRTGNSKPFEGFVKAVSLPDLLIANEPTPMHVHAPLVLGPCTIEDSATLLVKLLGGASAVRAPREQPFTLQAQNGSNRDWTITLADTDEPTIVARLRLDQDILYFLWNEQAVSKAAIARQLCNCALHLKVGSHEHIVALRTSMSGSPWTVDLEDRASSTLKWNIGDLPAARRLMIEVMNFEGCEHFRLQPKQPVSVGETITLSCAPNNNSSPLVLKLATSSTSRGITISLTPLVKLEGSREKLYRRSDLLELQRQATNALDRFRNEMDLVKNEPPHPDPMREKMAKGIRGKKLNDLSSEVAARQAFLEQVQFVTSFSATQPKIYFRVFHDTSAAQVNLVTTESPRR
jgi:serine/threonine protein kinase